MLFRMLDYDPVQVALPAPHRQVQLLCVALSAMLSVSAVMTSMRNTISVSLVGPGR
jgi:hypothetical protein